MLIQLRETVTSVLCHVELRVQRGEDEAPVPPPPRRMMVESRDDPAFAETAAEARGDVAVATASAAAAPWAKTPRNAPCPCGSGTKYKHCHGRI
jgi:preprotein translocase subunit SecA